MADHHGPDTELLAHRTRTRRTAMFFEAPKMRVVLATVHVPLMELRNLLTIGRVFDPIDLGHQACIDLGIPAPRIAVCGLNPHAGEQGLLGDEEIRIIQPAIQMAQDAGMNVHGPFPADTIFKQAIDGKWDLVVAMYHDQGLIPMKLAQHRTSVNWTIGLPIIRTADHGTAYDIAGTGQADAIRRQPSHGYISGGNASHPGSMPVATTRRAASGYVPLQTTPHRHSRWMNSSLCKRRGFICHI